MPHLQTTSELTLELKQKALDLGFQACGVSPAAELTDEKSRIEEWLGRGNHATMGWMENHLEKRVDPRKLVDGARSVISVIQSYYHPFEAVQDPSVGRISRYAWGEDYHLVMKEKLRALLEWLDHRYGGVNGRAFVDSAPMMDKVWAARSGLGWIGKHSNLISEDHGSWFFIGELVVDIELEPDRPVLDHCGSCTRCLDACPTGAIYEPYVVDANLCISYSTIEHRGADILPEITKDHGSWIFGCDICQEVCPWNKFKTESQEARYLPRDGVLDTELEVWGNLTQDEFSTRFRKSAIKRTKLEGFIRNVQYAQKNAHSAAPDEF
ncbi:MAG: tRNA epoxyqueuosine(34) reductase QueG [Bacteroidetes bacterium]|nr:tRNA epoxyqueuosine(34) reductase QueG [Bacteroidota bacterium]